MGGGVELEETTGGVLELWLLGAGEAGALRREISKASPWSFLIAIAQLFFAGRVKCGDCTTGGFTVAGWGCGVPCAMGGGAVWLVLEVGLLSDNCDELRDMG